MRITVICVLASLLSACASEYMTPQQYASIHGPEPTRIDIESSKEAVYDCFEKATSDMDDGLSSADVVGASIAAMCRKEGSAYASLKTWPMTDAQRQAFMREWPYSMKDVATAFVLKKRAAAKR